LVPIPNRQSLFLGDFCMPIYEPLPPDNFLGLDEEYSDYGRSAALILPIPYEGTVSYGQGPREGPRAIIHASQQVELYDRELDDEVALTHGIHTLPPPAPGASGPTDMPDAMPACAEGGRPSPNWQAGPRRE